MSGITPWRVFTTTAYAYLAFVISAVLRRLYFHPLSNFPGPTLAAATLWWQFYYDVILGGKLNARLITLHKQYGPVVRIGPNQLHFSCAQAYYDIYPHNSTFTKDPNFYGPMLSSRAVFGTIDRKQAKIRRANLAPFFSRGAVMKLEGVIQEKIDRFISQLLSYKDEPVNMHMGFRAASLDIIMEYLLARCYDTLGAPQFRHPTLVNLHEGTPAFWVFRHFPIVPIVIMALPRWLLVWLIPATQGVIDIFTTCERQSDEILANPDSLESASHDIIYHHLIAPDPAKGRPMATKIELVEEAHSLMRAGSDTVGGTCTMGTFHVLNNERIRARLLEELDEVRGDEHSPFTYEVLEKLPYLTAVIKESLRLNHGVVTPLPRVVGPEDAVIAGYHVPSGSVVAIGSTDIHCNEDIFPEPEKFDPERWLQPNSKELEKWLVAFSSGPRQCVGRNLAWCELYLMFGNLFAKVDMTIYDTEPEDMLNFDEYFIPYFSGKQFHVFTKTRSG